MYQITEPPTGRTRLILWGPKVLFAILILIVTHFVAKAVQVGLAENDRPHAGFASHHRRPRRQRRHRARRLAYWLVWLVGLIAALQPLGLSGVLAPVTSSDQRVFAFLPRLLGAGLFFFAGLILARIVRHVIEAALVALNLDGLLARSASALGDAPVRTSIRRPLPPGAAPGAPSQHRPRGRGDCLRHDHHLRSPSARCRCSQISAISDPATDMLNTIAARHPARAGRGCSGSAIAFIVAKLGQVAHRDGPAADSASTMRPRAWRACPATPAPSRIVATSP